MSRMKSEDEYKKTKPFTFSVGFPGKKIRIWVTWR